MQSTRSNRFRLSPRGVMLALVSAALSEAALANSGRVDFAVGNVVVTGANGRARALAKGAEVGTGDKIASGPDGRAQIRFSDGAYVSLQPNTEFDIKQYRFNGRTDGSESALFGLIRGALRTVTGLVGRAHRDKYQITTATATIGIRGTGGLIKVNNDGSTLVVGSSGVWSLTNKGGTLDIPAGKAGYAGVNTSVPPKLTDQGPVLPPRAAEPPKPELPPYVQGDVVNAAGSPGSIFGTGILPSGSGYILAGVGATAGFAAGPYPVNASFDGTGALTSFVDTANSTTYTAGGPPAEFGNDGVLAWGRWTGTVNVTTVNGTTPVTLSANDGLHYVVGVPATNMPISGTFTYNLFGATNPTLANGTVAPGTLNSAQLTGTWLGTATLTMSVSSAGTTFSGSASGTLTSSPVFALSSVTGVNVSVAGPTLGCSGGCALAVAGLFAGDGATRVGIMYQLNTINLTNGASSLLSGTAALK